MIKPIKYYIGNYYRQFRDAVDDILINFDCERVHKVMKYLDWEWAVEGNMEYTEVPETYVIRDHIRQALFNIENRLKEGQTEYFYSCGGIEIECRSYDVEELRKLQGPDVRDDFNDCVYLRVKFILEECENI